MVTYLSIANFGFREGYSRLCHQARPRPTRAPTPTVPAMKMWAPGIPIQARTTRPAETMAPAFVPGTGMKPRPSSWGGELRWRPTFSNTFDPPGRVETGWTRALRNANGDRSR